MTIIKPLTFDNLRYANVQRNKEWDPDNVITASYRGLELAGEVGELCNQIKKIERERLGLRGSAAGWLTLVDELADSQITLDLVAMQYNVDLGLATQLKFNRTSEKMHLGTRL